MNNYKRLDLSYSNLSNSDLSCSDLSYSNLRGSDLRGSDLRGSDLRGSDLSWSNLRGSDLSYSNLRGSDLSGSNIDFSAWHLSCKTLSAKIDEKIITQLLYHASMPTQNNKLELSDDLIELLNSDLFKKIVNKFHRVEECGKFNGTK